MRIVAVQGEGMIADRGSISQGDFDALADLFLGAGATPAAQPPSAPASRAEEAAGGVTPTPATATVAAAELPRARSRTSPTVEVLLLAHVPVMAASWATQYARLRVEGGEGPVALVRLGEDRARVEAVGVTGLPSSADLATGIAEARGHVSCMIVFPAPELNSDELVVLAGAITLMTTPDEAGVVAAYTVLKQLASLCEAGGQSGPKPIRLVMLGGDPVRAQTAIERLRDAATSFLHAQLDDRLIIERLAGGTPPVVLYDGPWIGTPGGLMHDLLAAAAAPGQGAVTAGPVEAPRPIDQARGGPAPAATAGLPPGSLRDETDVLSGALGGAGFRAEEPAESAVRAEAVVPPAITTRAAEVPGNAVAPAGVDLIALLPGVRALAARCPHAEGVQLGVDARGTLHAAVQTTDSAEAGWVAQLMTAGAWAEVNRRVLGLLVGPGGAPIGEGPAVLHVFTPKPAGCRRLLDTGLKVHAIAAGGPGACVAIELN